ncbi:MAG TPA: LysR family transcriptional regulator [Bdellovibrionales bacterium]|nr:LysR family transcriptional regulator [Bdellovibrionales bacterium]
MDLFQDLSWELSVLARSVAYKNLSGASAQVGLSQPQLSRIVSRLEGALGVVLLDRTVRRNSGWTPTAHRLAELFVRASRHLQSDLQKVLEGTRLREVRIGALEGLMPAAMSFAQHVFDAGGAELVELDIFDLNVLEESFQKESLDFIFTIREPGRRKHTYVRTLGVQTMNTIDKGREFTVVSPFEFSSRLKQKAKGKVLISNSLEIRKQWLAKHGGRGAIPSGILPGRQLRKDENEVLLIGSEQLTPGFWETVRGFKF